MMVKPQNAANLVQAWLSRVPVSVALAALVYTGWFARGAWMQLQTSDTRSQVNRARLDAADATGTLYDHQQDTRLNEHDRELNALGARRMP